MTDWISLRIHEEFYLSHWVYYLEHTFASDGVGQRSKDCLQLEEDEDILNSFYNLVLALGHLSAPPSITPENIGYIVLPIAPKETDSPIFLSASPASQLNNPRKRSEPCADVMEDLGRDAYQPISNFLSKLTQGAPHLHAVFAHCRIISAMPAFLSPHDSPSRIPTPSPAFTQCLLRALTLSMAHDGYRYVPVAALEPWTGAGMVSSSGGGATAPVGPGPGASTWLMRHSTRATRLAVHLLPLWRVSGEMSVDADTSAGATGVSAACSAPVLHLRVLARPAIATSAFPSLRTLLLAHEPTLLPSPVLTASDSTSATLPSAQSLTSTLPPPPVWSPLPAPVPVIVAGTQRGVATHVRVGVRRVLPGACVCEETYTATDKPTSSEGSVGSPCVNAFALHRYPAGVHNIGSNANSRANVNTEASANMDACVDAFAGAGCGQSGCEHSEALAWRTLGSDIAVDGMGAGKSACAGGVSRFPGMRTHTLPLGGTAVASPDDLHVADAEISEAARIRRSWSTGAAERTWLSWGVQCASIPATWRALQRLQVKRHSAAPSREHDGYSGFDGDCDTGDGGDSYGETAATSPLEDGLLGDWEIEKRLNVKKNGGVSVSDVDYDARVHVAVRVELQGSDAEEHLPQQVVCVCASALTGMCEVRHGRSEEMLWRDIATNMPTAAEAETAAGGAAGTGYVGAGADMARVRARVVAEARDALAALCARVRVARPVEDSVNSVAEAVTATSTGAAKEAAKDRGGKRGKTAAAPRKRAKKGGAAAAEMESAVAEEEVASATGPAASATAHNSVVSTCPFTVARDPWLPPPAFAPLVPRSARVASLNPASPSDAFTDVCTASAVAMQRIGGHPAAATFTTARDMYRRALAPAATPAELDMFGGAAATWRASGDTNGGLPHGLSGYGMGSDTGGGMAGGLGSDYGSGFSSAATFSTYDMHAGNPHTGIEHVSGDSGHAHGHTYGQPADFTAGADPSVTAEEREAVQRAFGFIFSGGGGAVRRVERDGYDGGMWGEEEGAGEEDEEEEEGESIPLSAYAKLVAPLAGRRAARRGPVLQGSGEGTGAGGARAVAEVEALAFVLFAKRHWHVAAALAPAALTAATPAANTTADGVPVSAVNSFDMMLTPMSGDRAGGADDIESLAAWVCGGFPAIEPRDSAANPTPAAAIDAVGVKTCAGDDHGRVCVFLCALWACESHLVRKKYEMLARDVSARMKAAAHAA